MSELLPCPFCGGEPERVELTDRENFGGSVICCKSCMVSSPVHFDRKENLDDSWNRRAPSPSPAPAVVEALRKARQLVDIATDWNLDEVEIDGEMVRTYLLGAEFDTALASLSQPAKGEREGGGP